MTSNSLSKWEILKEVIRIRTIRPSQHPEFWMYSILINIIFGALGVYVSVVTDLLQNDGYFDYRSLTTNLGTFFIAILASGCFDLILSKAKIMKTSISMFSIMVLVLGIIALIVSAIVRVRYALPISVIFCCVSLYIWWIANAENDKLMSDEVSISDLTGGNLSQKILGDLNGYKTN